MKEKNKKTIIVSGLFALLMVAGFANYVLTTGFKKNEAESVNAKLLNESTELVEKQDSFDSFRDERTKSRNQQIEYIESVLSGTDADADTKKEAEQMKLVLAENMEKELTSEGLIKTKLAVEAVVSCGNNMVNVVVGKNELTEDEVTQIVDIIEKQTEVSPQNIKIMPSNENGY